MSKLTFIVATLLIFFSINCLAQGKVTRPVKTQAQTSKPKKAAANVKVSEPVGYINGHGYVDLGLPSGVKWATCNVGATSPSENGSYFACGETSPKSSYTKNNSKTYGKTITQLQSEGIIDSQGKLTKSYDAAASNWGSSWRMPTREELDELLNKCNWQWTKLGGKNGYKVIGTNGNSIFVPASGYRYGSSLGSVGEDGYCCSSSVYGDTGSACCLYFDGGNYGTVWYIRYDGLSVRPVSE